jgi:hypothetical protein
MSVSRSDVVPFGRPAVISDAARGLVLPPGGKPR